MAGQRASGGMVRACPVQEVSTSLRRTAYPRPRRTPTVPNGFLRLGPGFPPSSCARVCSRTCARLDARGPPRIENRPQAAPQTPTGQRGGGGGRRRLPYERAWTCARADRCDRGSSGPMTTGSFPSLGTTPPSCLGDPTVLPPEGEPPGRRASPAHAISARADPDPIRAGQVRRRGRRGRLRGGAGRCAAEAGWCRGRRSTPRRRCRPSGRAGAGRECRGRDRADGGVVRCPPRVSLPPRGGVSEISGSRGPGASAARPAEMGKENPLLPSTGEVSAPGSTDPRPVTCADARHGRGGPQPVVQPPGGCASQR